MAALMENLETKILKGKNFDSPNRSFMGLDANSTAKLIAATADIALVLDRNGVIEDISIGQDSKFPPELMHWVGKPWIDTVSMDSRPKVQEMLKSSIANGTSSFRHLNHPLPGRLDLPIKYLLHKLDGGERLVALGQDQSAVAMLQQRLVETQQSVEREYSQIRSAETRYRLLFQIIREPILIVEGVGLKVREANPAALSALNGDVKKIVGRSLLARFDAGAKQVIENYLEEVRLGQSESEVDVTLADEGATITVCATSFRQDGQTYFLVRLFGVNQPDAAGPGTHSLDVLIENMPDAFVVTDINQNIVSANAAFIDLAQMPNFEQLRGKPLRKWLGRSEIEFQLLVNELQDRGTIRKFSTVIRGSLNVSEEVETSAVEVRDGTMPCFGYSFRQLSQSSLGQMTGKESGLHQSVEKLAELVGRVPMKDIVRETTDMIERMCIEAALNLTEDNRASAADVLGLSRQSLYVKLRRFGLRDFDSNDMN